MKKIDHLVLIKIGQLLIILAIITLTFLMVYIIGQQILRQTANSPQIQLAEDISRDLGQGLPMANLDSAQKTDMGLSLASFLLVYDSQEKVLASSGQLNNQVPLIPIGVLHVADIKGENKITWMPNAHNRFAIIVVPFKNTDQSGYVVVGRSLRESEAISSGLLKLVASGWLGAMFLAILGFCLPYILKK